MIIRSHLPTDVGYVGEAWRKELEGDIRIGGELVFPEQGSTPIIWGDKSIWLTEQPTLRDLITVIDAHFREIHQVEPSTISTHAFEVRANAGCMSALSQSLRYPKPEELNNAPAVPKILRAGAPHVDRPAKSTNANAGPKQPYIISAGNNTEWFEGTYLAPKDNRIASTLVHFACLAIETTISRSWQAEDDHLLAVGENTVHRMPKIDLSAMNRYFLKDVAATLGGAS